MRTDHLFYRLFQDWPGLALDLVGLDPALPGYRLEAIEVKQTALRLDGVLVPPEQAPEAPLIFIETQFQHDPDFHARWFAELFLYLHRHPPRRAWRALALFANQAAEQGTRRAGQSWHAEPAYEPLLAHPWVKRVYLQEALDEGLLPSRAHRILGLVFSDPRRVVDEARALLNEPRTATEPPRAVLADWIETLLVYKLPRLSREEIRVMLELLDVDLKQTRFYQEVFDEGREKGRREEQRRLAQALLDLIEDDRLLAERTGLSEAEVHVLRAQTRA